MNEIQYMVALEKHAELERAIERAHLIEEMRGPSKPQVRRRMATFAMAGSAAAALLLLMLSRLHG